MQIKSKYQISICQMKSLPLLIKAQQYSGM